MQVLENAYLCRFKIEEIKLTKAQIAQSVVTIIGGSYIIYSNNWDVVWLSLACCNIWVNTRLDAYTGLLKEYQTDENIQKFQ